MLNKNKKEYILFSATLILCIAMLILMLLLTIRIGKTTGFIIGFCIYWFIFCFPLSLYCSNGLGKLTKLLCISL